MILTLYLISTNVYNSVDAPKNRGFSYLEVWLVGTQFPILLALCEYGFILYLKKNPKGSDDKIGMLQLDHVVLNLDEKINQIDFIVMFISFISFVLFASFYCIFLLT